MPVWRQLDYWLNKTSLRARRWIGAIFALLLIAAIVVISTGMLSWGEEIIDKVR